MRLTSDEQRIIKTTIREYFGSDTVVLLFGSRVDNHLKGGDIDLFIESELDAATVVERKIQCLTRLKQQLGDQKIDLVVKRKPVSAALSIFDHAERTGVQL